MSMINNTPRITSKKRQRGVATLMVALVILVILTVIVLASTNVALFEQRTATNENRQRLADQVAKYALDLGGEFMKANIVHLGSKELGGWLAPNTLHWLPCSGEDGFDDNTMDDIGGRPHPCMAEPDPVRRAELYFYSTASPATDTSILVPFDSLLPDELGKINSAGGTALFESTATVRALLCRIDTTLENGAGEPEPACQAEPSVNSQNRLAITIISNSRLPGESAASEAKETWASFNSVASSSTVPLVASGAVDGTGNVTIVTDPDGAGVGLPVSIWSAADADVDKTGGFSAASVSSCQLGDFLNKPYRDHGDEPTPELELKTTCVTDGNACGCPAAQLGGSDFLSGKVPGGGAANACCERLDILDIDGGKGSPNPIPDILFFPGKGYDHLVGEAPNTAVSNASALADDSLFEWVFGVSEESRSTRSGAPLAEAGDGNTLVNCGDGGDENCAIWYLTSADQLNAQTMNCTAFGAIGAEASGLYYITDSPCPMPAQVGSPESQAIVVVNDEASLHNTVFFGMIFVRSDTKTGYLRANGNAMVIGSVVVEGATDITGGLNIVYDPTKTEGSGKKLPRGTRLGRVSGSWLDNNRGGF